MAKAKITFLMEMEYEINAENYHEVDDTDEKRLQYDLKVAEQEFQMYLKHAEFKLVEVEGCIIEEEENTEKNIKNEEKPVDK